MTQEFITNLVINQVGEDKAKEIKEMLLNLAQKMSGEKIYILTGLGERGVCLISTDKEHCKFDIKGKNGEQPNITELEKMIKDIEI